MVNFRLRSKTAARLTRALIARLRALDLPSGLRLDFNSSLDEGAYARFIAALGDDRDSIDYVEDPTPWRDENGFGVIPTHPPVAVDLEATRAAGNVFAPSVRIVKPAAQAWEILLANATSARTVISTYLDHPLGQCFAAWVAATHADAAEAHALASHLAYEANEFSERLGLEGAHLRVPMDGMGIGFDDLLERRAWTEVSHG